MFTSSLVRILPEVSMLVPILYFYLYRLVSDQIVHFIFTYENVTSSKSA